MDEQKVLNKRGGKAGVETLKVVQELGFEH